MQLRFVTSFLFLLSFCGIILIAGYTHGMAQVRLTADPVSSDSLPRVSLPPQISNPFYKRSPQLYYISPPEEQTVVQLDTSGTYLSRRYIHQLPAAWPYVLNFKEFSKQSRRHSISENWQKLINEKQTSQQQQGGLLDFKVDVPGGQGSTFTTIFGRPEVNININGTANMNVGASIQKLENPRIPPDQQTQVDPTFEQNLRLNIQGTIGDKLSIQTDWDTERAFDFMNRLHILYEGYDDEILQRLEMGNVSMRTGNSLIRGGNALFGVKSVAQVGALTLTSVLSQQEGEGNTETITGGAQEQEINIHPADYEEDRHFFLDFFTRQQFEENFSNPQQLGQALQLTEVNVWVLRESTEASEGERQAIALADLGVVSSAGEEFLPPDEEQDIFSAALLAQFRDPSLGVSATDFGVDPSSFVEGYFTPLQEGVDYELNRALGYLSLKRNLGSRQALAVSFRYRDAQTGETVGIGDISQAGGDRLYLKLIRPQTVTTNHPLWDLMMKNVYSIGANNLTPDGLDIDISYTGENVSSSSLPERNSILLQDLGLDRVDQQGALNPDNEIDFSTNVLHPVTGRIIFPYLEPFGRRIAELLTVTPLSPEQVEDLSFQELYEQRQVNASQNSKNNFYLIEGRSRGSVSANYSLGYSLVEGSVQVYANGRELQEGTDYAVDYSIGSITILNEQYLNRGQEIRIEYENNQLAQIGRKTFTGLRAEYEISDNIRLGSTYFNLTEKPLQDKIRIGEEPVNNAVIGLDANAHFNAPWLTRLLDRAPLLQTKAPSSVMFSGEFAQLRPGISQTGAVNDAIDGNRLFEDEEQGLSFIDDFEGSDIGLSFLNPARWSLAAAPAAVPGHEADSPYFAEDPPPTPNTTLADKVARSDLRSQFSWFSIPQNIDEILGGVQHTPETRPVEVTDVFPNRDVLTEENFITTLDVFYDPTERGPYNYHQDLRNLLQNEPERTWGGMTTTLPSGQEDLTQNNIEFLEFWVQSVLPSGRSPNAQDLQDYEGIIYIDIGIVSEDVVPNYKTNTEDGLARRPDDLQQDNIGGASRSYIPVPPPAPEGQFSNETRALEDVGLDGAPNREGLVNRNELNLFSSFLENMRSQYGTGGPSYAAILEDPSNDDYVYYGEPEVANLPLQERFHRMRGYQDGNTPPNTGEKRAVTNRPDTEGLITPSIVEQNNAYYQYEVEWNPADMDNLEIGAPGTYIVDKIDGPNQEDRWYQVQIPLEDWVRRVGNIENFQNISYIRIWLSGYEEPFTLRFATFELVGSQWRTAEGVEEEQGPTQGDYTISSVNIEENSQRRPFPYRQPEGAIRAMDRSRQRQTISNEQSIVMDVQNLAGGELKMMKRIYPGGLNMINYSHLRMFVHGEGYDGRGEAELVMRFGNGLTNNYYEYRQPISPSDPGFAFSGEPLSELSEMERRVEAEQIWLYNNNSVNILLRAFNELKQLRDQQGVDMNEVFERSNLLQQAPPGAVVAIKGNPSLDRVGEIGVGIRNPFDPQNPEAGGVASLDGQFWFNELRVSGFNNRSGWATNAKAEINLADVASVNANLNRETDGFGALDSRLGQRRISDLLAYDLNSVFNMHKFLPARYGWNIPLSLSTRKSSTTPRYLPNQGDVRLLDFRNAVNARADITEQEKQTLINERIEASQTVSESFSLNLSNVTKNDSQSPLLHYTLDNLTLDYVYNDTRRNNPRYIRQDNWNYSGNLRYDLNLSNTPLFRPFNFLKQVPLLHPLAGVRVGYLPSSVNASTGIEREYNEQLRRLSFTEEERLLQQTHAFTYNTQFGLGYNITPSVTTTFQNRTVFDLSNAGVVNEAGAGPGGPGRFALRPTSEVLSGVIFDSLSSRRNNYDEAYTAGWQPRLDLLEPFNWMDYSANYGGGYQWRNSPLNSGLGAIISNNLSLNQSLNFDMQGLLRKMPWYRELTAPPSLTGSAAPDSAGTAAAGVGEEVADAGRSILQSLLSIQSLEMSFNVSKNSLQSGYAGDSQLFYMFNTDGDHFSPPFSYRTGIGHDIDRQQLIDNPNESSSIQLPSSRTLTDDITVASRFRPLDNLSVDFTWNTQWDETYAETITIAPDESMSSVFTQSGRLSSSVWVFGGGYSAFFQKQLQTAFEDLNMGSEIISDVTGNGDGRSVLGKIALQEDFREAYLGIGTGAIGKRNFTPFPLPGWRVTWSGIESYIPYFNLWIARASLTHNYSGRYRMGWVYNLGSGGLPPTSLGIYTIENQRPVYEPNTINIEKIFSPLLGLNITWLSGLRTNVQYEFNQVTSLALSNSSVIERLSRGLKLTLGYSVRNFKLPFLPRLDNAMDFTINGSYIEDEEEKFRLGSDLGNVLEVEPGQLLRDPDQYEFTSSFTGGQSRINGSAIIGYQFSQTIKANFEYTFRRLIPKSSSIYARTDHDLRFNVIVSIRSD